MNTKVCETIKEYFKTKPIQKAWLFGSFSRGEERPDSDVDIIISFMPGTKMGLQFFAMIIDLEKLLNRPVDLVVDGDILSFASENVNKDKVLIYERAA
ncbi:MAG: nucleotidyltransferase domain-containing protein [Prevotellaceae bacterium]|nr:nucleotidyltransferase domain-containing protein [Candidatus Minthosoma caballi]